MASSKLSTLVAAVGYKDVIHLVDGVSTGSSTLSTFVADVGSKDVIYLVNAIPWNHQNVLHRWQLWDIKDTIH